MTTTMIRSLALLWVMVITTMMMTLAVPDNDDDKYTFEQYLVDFEKSYESVAELERHKVIFYDNLQIIRNHNNQRAQSQLSNTNQSGGYWMGVNSFTDLAQEDYFWSNGYTKSLYQQASTTSFLQAHTGFVPNHNLSLSDPPSSLPSFVDWRTRGVTTPIKSQGLCGSCWAFASIAAMESHLAIQTTILMELSLQELVSCVPNQRACGGTGGVRIYHHNGIYSTQSVSICLWLYGRLT